MEDQRLVGRLRIAVARQAPSPLPELPELPVAEDGEISRSMTLAPMMDKECLLAMLKTHAAVDNRSGGGGARGGEDAGGAGAIQMGMMARLASSADLEHAMRDPRPSPRLSGNTTHPCQRPQDPEGLQAGDQLGGFASLGGLNGEGVFWFA